MFDEPRGVFVTLKRYPDDALRGCMDTRSPSFRSGRRSSARRSPPRSKTSAFTPCVGTSSPASRSEDRSSRSRSRWTHDPRGGDPVGYRGAGRTDCQGSGRAASSCPRSPRNRAGRRRSTWTARARRRPAPGVAGPAREGETIRGRGFPWGDARRRRRLGDREATAGGARAENVTPSISQRRTSGPAGSGVSGSWNGRRGGRSPAWRVGHRAPGNRTLRGDRDRDLLGGLRPSSLRVCCRRRATSRASPSSASSGVGSRGRAATGCKDGPFVRVDCATLPSNLVKSELFGYEKGAFTGAVSQRQGKVERADKGTLFSGRNQRPGFQCPGHSPEPHPESGI